MIHQSLYHLLEQAQRILDTRKPPKPRLYCVHVPDGPTLYFTADSFEEAFRAFTKLNLPDTKLTIIE